MSMLTEYKHMTELKLSSNAYITQYSKNKWEIISETGLHNWESDETVVTIYFYAKTAFKFDLFIKCMVPSGQSVLQLNMNRSLYSVTGDVTVSDTKSSYKNFTVGSYEVQSKGYHRFDLRGLTKTGNFFADVSAIIIGQTSDEDNVVAIESDTDRRGSSLHLGYVLPNGTPEYFYSEVNVLNGYDPIGSYYMAVGFNHGYFGIQVNSETERSILFSVWSPQDSGKITDENKVKVTKQGKDVKTGEFGNEGSGTQTWLTYNWKTGSTIKFLVRGRLDPNDKTRTEYMAWFALEDNVWKLMAALSRPKTTEHLSGFHSFLEDFKQVSGYLTRKAHYGNQWMCDTDGKWHELTQAKLVGDSSAKKKVRFDFDGGVEVDRTGRTETFFLMNGGFFEGSTALESILTRKANNVEPKIDLKSLP